MAHLIQLSEAASIALHSVALMAGSPGSLFSVKKIAHHSGVSVNHLAKVMQRLVKSGILASSRGPKGGFSMALPLEQVSLLDIYEAIEGRLSNSPCTLNRKKCIFNECMFGSLFSNLNQEVSDYLKHKKISDFAPNKSEGEQNDS